MAIPRATYPSRFKGRWDKLGRRSALLAGVGLLTVAWMGTRESWPAPGDWAYYGHDVSNTKFSELTQINTGNVHRLKEAWQYRESREGSSLFFNPLVVDGRMIAFLPSQRLVALHPTSGKLLWEFVPDSSSVLNWSRSVTYHRGTSGRPDTILFVYGSTLYSIRASDGQLMNGFGDRGRVDFYEGLAVADSMRGRVHVTSNAPGVIYHDLFIIGCKVPDELPSTSGDIRAFDVNTGRLVWVFHTIPKTGEYGADTWARNARSRNGGANCWGGMALDERRGIVYVPTASPSFDFYGADRPGQNLFANCLLALDARTGKRRWHFQTTHHDLWDRDNGSPPNLVTVTHHGKPVDAVALVTKMGYLFLFDRVSGAPLFPIREVPVPTRSPMPGEKPWPTQPIPTRPAPFARQGFKQEFYSTVTPEMAQYVRRQVTANRYDTGIYEPPNLVGSIIVPAAHGGANWGGASVNPQTGVLFVNATDLPWFLKLTELKTLGRNNGLSGEALYKLYCSNCHGTDRKGTSYGPDIVAKTATYAPARLESIIRKGAEPMPSFKHLPAEQITAIIAYLKGAQAGQLAHRVDSTDESAEPYGFSGYDFFQDANGIPAIKPPYGTLTAIDLNNGTIRWQVPLGEDSKLAKLGIRQSGMFNRGGGIATAGGLVFIAATGDKMVRAFDQQTGKIRWETQLPGSSTGIPTTYSIDGKQYVTVSVSPSSTGYKGGYVTFSLGD